MSDAMNTPNLSPQSQRLLDLLADRATGSLSAGELEECESLLRRVPRLCDAEGNEITPQSVESPISHVLLAMASGSGRLPADVRERLLARGRELTREARNRSDGRFSEISAGSADRNRANPALGWLAAAAAIAVAAVFYIRSVPSIPISAAEARMALLQRPETLRVAWQPQGSYAAADVSGDVVWNQQTQTGFIRFHNLPALNPAVDQYQLWIFDAQREAYPVDGGVFDLDRSHQDSSSGDHIVPINAKLPVKAPAAFAVTVEKAGGVVVTDKSRLVSLAPVGGK